MSTYVVGIKPADEKFKKMYEIYKKCEEAEVNIPKEVEEFFNDEEPDKKGVIIDIREMECCKEWGDDSREGFEIDIAKIPKDIKIIRFYNSY